MRRGFTLIELLVVIAIIAILAAVLFPIFVRAKMTANTQKCSAHGRQLGMAMMMYMEDNSGRFPSAATQAALDKVAHIAWEYDWPGTPWKDTWRACSTNQMRFIQLAAYTRSRGIWICPSPHGLHGLKYARGYECSWHFVSSKKGFGTQVVTYPDTPFQTWYAQNDPRNGVGRTPAEVFGEDIAKYHRYTSPAKKVFAFCYGLGPDIPIEAYPSGPLVTPYYPHDGGSIYVYYDGHAKWRETGCGWAPVGYTNSSMDRRHI